MIGALTRSGASADGEAAARALARYSSCLPSVAISKVELARSRPSRVTRLGDQPMTGSIFRKYPLLAMAPRALVGVHCNSGIDPESPREDDSTAEAASNLTLHAGPGGLAFDYAHRPNLIHGVAGDEQLVFSTEPLNGRVAVLDRFNSDEQAVLPPPSGGFLLPFSVRVPRPGRVVVLDSGGFPDPAAPAIPRIYDYDYTWNRVTHQFTATLVRTVTFAGQPVVFAEDIEVASDGTYYMSDSVIGSIWVVHPNGGIVPGIFPAPGMVIPAVGPCKFTPITIDGIPFTLGGNFAPGVGKLAVRGDQLYFTSTCLGGLQRVPRAALVDPLRSPDQRASDIHEVSPRPANVVEEAFEGVTFNRWNSADAHAYVSDAFQGRVLRIDVNTGEREVVVAGFDLFDFPTALQFLPPVFGLTPLVVSSDQEHRLAWLNAAITTSLLHPPFIIAKVYVHDKH